MDKTLLVVAGGGAAGFFGAISAKENGFQGDIIILEKSAKLLSKVLVSGGGRCNVTHACFDNDILAGNYPRGNRELRGPFSSFSPTDTIRWFEGKGVKLKTEDDGRIFPVTNKSETIAECLVTTAEKNGIRIRTQTGIRSFIYRDGFELLLTDGSTLKCKYLLLATGGQPKEAGYDWITACGHHISSPVPSLFTFNIPDSPFRGLEGVAWHAEINIGQSNLKTTGPVLVTHWGLSGPAVLRLSAIAARHVHGLDYKFDVRISFMPGSKQEEITDRLRAKRVSHPSKKISVDTTAGLPSRLWQRLTELAKIDEFETWGQLKKENLLALSDLLFKMKVNVQGKTTYKEEFVTCGGISLREINMRTMESKLVPGLYFAGELIDVDGITGGFNFQNAWTTGFIAGRAIAEKHLPDSIRLSPQA